MIYIVDTHGLVWFLDQPERLGTSARSILTDPESALVVPTIVLAEIRYLAASRRITPTFDAVLRVILDDPRFDVFPLDGTVVELMPLSLNIHDAIVVSTALALADADDVTVVTRDREITESGVVRTIW